MKLKSVVFSALFAVCSIVLISSCNQSGGSKSAGKKAGDTTAKAKGEEADTLSVVKSSYPPIDKAKYDELLKFNAHTDTSGRWPVKNSLTP
jgi:flagellar motility protein MotE (MotC chaperone)